MERLVIKNPERSTRTQPLTSDVLVIGRQRYCDVVLQDNATSREHAKLTRSPSGWIVEDLQSRNGVRVNGRRIDKPTLVGANDTIQIGTSVLSIEDDSLVSTPSDSASSPQEQFSWRDDSLDLTMIKSEVGVGGSGRAWSILAERQKRRTVYDCEREIAFLEERVRVLLDVARILGKVEDAFDLIPRFLDNLLRLFPNADAACFIAPVRDDESDDPERRVWKLIDHKRRDESDSRPFKISRAIVRHVVSTKTAVLSDSPADDLRFDSYESILASQISSVMCAPIYDAANDKTLGAIQIDSRRSGKTFEHNDLKLLVLVANQIAVYMENQIYRDDLVKKKEVEREMRLANQVQRSLLPLEPPKLEGYEFFDYYRPAKNVGGDYFDYIPLSDGSLAIILGDVSGHGVSASLVMVNLSSEARYGLALEKTTSAAMERLNRIILEKYRHSFFVTLVLLVLDPKTGTTRIFNAGHPAPVVSKVDGSSERVGEGRNGFMLGVVPDSDYPEFVYQLQEGESIAIMSDGLADAMNPSDERFTDERILEELKNPTAMNVEQLGRRLVDNIKIFEDSAEQSDDQCLVVLRRLPRGASIPKDSFGGPTIAVKAIREQD